MTVATSPDLRYSGLPRDAATVRHRATWHLCACGAAVYSGGSATRTSSVSRMRLSISGCALPVRGGGGHDSAIKKTGTSLQRRIASSATPYLHTWVGAHVAKILTEFHESVRREPLIPLGASLGFVPKPLYR